MQITIGAAKCEVPSCDSSIAITIDDGLGSASTPESMRAEAIRGEAAGEWCCQRCGHFFPITDSILRTIENDAAELARTRA